MFMHSVIFQKFNSGIATKVNTQLVKDVNKFALKAGYFIDPRACDKNMLEIVKDLQFNPNTTFYKTFKEVEDKNELELLVDQIIHYVSTYGTNFEGFTYTCNNSPVNIPFTEFKFIAAKEPEEIFNLIRDLFKQNIALDSDSLRGFVDFFRVYNFDIDVEEVKNKELKTLLCYQTKKIPEDKFEILRLMVYIITQNTQIIQNDELLRNIERNVAELSDKDNALLAECFANNLIKLSEIFFRYKKLFIVMKNIYTSSYINKIRKLATKNKVPFSPSYWENCITNNDTDFAKKDVKNISSFKIITLLSLIKKSKIENTHSLYRIRNGKVFVKENNKKSNVNYELETILKKELFKRIKNNLQKENGFKTVKLPSSISIALPTSEKNFIGNFPEGSKINMNRDNLIVGIYWRNEWNTKDFDLHFRDDFGESFGWNSSYKDENVIYSGDMTNADPEAAECMLIKNNIPDGTFTVSQFCTFDETKESKFRFFVAVDEVENLEKNYMVNPNKIIFTTDIKIKANKNCPVARIDEKTLYLQNFDVSGLCVPDESVISNLNKAMKSKVKSYLYFEDIFKELGITIVCDDEEADIDLTNPTINELLDIIK